jgi:hypothetical protein
MIHVIEQQEPLTFDANVRQRGQRYLQEIGVDSNQPLPPRTTLEPYWRDCLEELYIAYSGVCAYLAVHFERITGAGSVDHFVAKSSLPSMAYEWNNYRLACLRMNSRKREFEDVLDPFAVVDGWFHLELVSGRVFANRRLTPDRIASIDATIERLGLDDFGCREMRARHYEDYCRGLYPREYLRQRSPFVWMEANRQGLL